MKKEELTLKEKKQMAKDRGISLELLEKLLSAQPAPSTSDSLFQSTREDEDRELTSIQMRLFRQEMQRSDD